jgi:hypothetical protein
MSGLYPHHTFYADQNDLRAFQNKYYTHSCTLIWINLFKNLHDDESKLRAIIIVRAHTIKLSFKIFRQESNYATSSFRTIIMSLTNISMI